MIGAEDMAMAMTHLLQKHGFLVVSMDVKEAAPRPSCGVDVLASDSEVDSWAWIQDTYTVTVYYYPATETVESILRAADRLRPIILRCPLEIDGRSIDADKVSVGRENNVLVLEAEYTITQNPQENETEPETIENLELRME